MWTNQDKRCTFTEQSLATDALTFLSFLWQHIHFHGITSWASPPSVPATSMNYTRPMRTMSIHREQASKQNCRNLKKQTICYQGKPSRTSLCRECLYLTIQVTQCSGCFTLSVNSLLTSSLGSRNKIMPISLWKRSGTHWKKIQKPLSLMSNMKEKQDERAG